MSAPSSMSHRKGLSTKCLLSRHLTVALGGASNSNWHRWPTRGGGRTPLIYVRLYYISELKLKKWNCYLTSWYLFLTVLYFRFQNLYSQCECLFYFKFPISSLYWPRNNEGGRGGGSALFSLENITLLAINQVKHKIYFKCMGDRGGESALISLENITLLAINQVNPKIYFKSMRDFTQWIILGHQWSLFLCKESVRDSWFPAPFNSFVILSYYTY